VGRLTTDADASRQAIDATEAEAKALSGELGQNEGAITTRLGTLEAEQTGKTKHRNEVIKRLPTQIFRRYDLVRSKRGTGLAHTTTGTCTACNMSLPPQLFHKLRREPLLEQCPSCNRIIYFLPPEAADSPHAKG
jgi:predicted  nucleic acid-binding Zn-ribbon protein